MPDLDYKAEYEKKEAEHKTLLAEAEALRKYKTDTEAVAKGKPGPTKDAAALTAAHQTELAALKLEADKATAALKELETLRAFKADADKSKLTADERQKLEVAELGKARTAAEAAKTAAEKHLAEVLVRSQVAAAVPRTARIAELMPPACFALDDQHHLTAAAVTACAAFVKDNPGLFAGTEAGKAAGLQAGGSAGATDTGAKVGFFRQLREAKATR